MMPMDDPEFNRLGLVADIAIMTAKLLVADIAIMTAKLAVIESVARQAGVDLVTAREALDLIWERHGDDRPSLEGMIDMIDEAIAAL